MNFIKTLLLGTFTLIFSTIVHANAEKAKLNILATTDIHSYIMNYNYYQDKIDENVGLNKLSSLVKEIRAKNPNTILLDNGDLIQGNPLADYIINNTNLKNKQHPLMAIMEYMGYDAINLGNHEFNYGLEKLDQIVAKTSIPFVSSNVFNTNNSTKFKPYLILTKEIITNKGKKKTLKVGVTSAVTPQIMLWDKSNLEGKVYTKDIVDEVKKSVAELKKQKVDLIIVLAHSGIGNYSNKYTKNSENTVYELSKIKDIDFIISGHDHKTFPVKDGEKQSYADSTNVNNKSGIINNSYVVMSSSFAKYLGVFDVDLEYNNNKWQIKNVVVSLQKPTKVDTKVNDIIAQEHKNTIKYINSKIGSINQTTSNYFARVNEDFSIELVNKAQIWYAEELKKNVLSNYKDLPVIASMAPFKNGGRSGADYYTNVEKGNLSIKNVADLYVYPNTVMVLKINGKELREYLEWSAQNFNDLKLSTKEQGLINENIPSYNYDIVDGVSYTINLNNKNRYQGDSVVNKNSFRITELKYKGKNIKDSDRFLLVTNNYRANTSAIVNKGSKNLVYDAQVENKEILINYIKAHKNIVNKIDNNIKVIYPKNSNIVFETSKKAVDTLKDNKNIEYVKDTKDGFALYKIVN